MDVIQWVLLALFFLLLFIGLKDGIKGFFYLWATDGLKFAILTAILLILFVAPSLTKQFAPQFYDGSKLALMLYVIGLLLYRFAFKRGGSN